MTIRSAWMVMVAVAACGPGLKREPVTPEALIGGEAKLRALLRGSVVNGGLLFDDASCNREFGVRGLVKSERLDAFARCLAGLQLTKSARKDTLGAVVVMEHAPGFELQARLLDEASGPRLAWIGFASRPAGDPDVPTITPAALERLRLAGDRVEPALATTLESDEHGAYAWFKICLDTNGAISKTEAYLATGAKTRKAFEDAIATWRFRPFVMRGQPLPVCAVVRLVARGQAPAVEALPLPPPTSGPGHGAIVIPARLLEGQRLSGEKAILPDDMDRLSMQNQGVARIDGIFRVCVSVDGTIASVELVQSTRLERFDTKLLRAIRAWKYSPYLVDDRPVPVCTIARYVYTQSDRVNIVR